MRRSIGAHFVTKGMSIRAHFVTKESWSIGVHFVTKVRRGITAHFVTKVRRIGENVVIMVRRIMGHTL